MSSPTITLYTGQTPNGIKISITLEELGLPYNVRKIDMSSNEQKSDWFLQINPNGRIPAITDIHEDGKEIRVFESGSIMQYLVDRYDVDHKISYPRGSREWIETNSWLFVRRTSRSPSFRARPWLTVTQYMNAGVGPMQGQANHFLRYAPEHVPYGIKRYQDETRRLYGVLDKHLREAGTDYLVGNKCTIADIAHWGWIALARWSLGGDPPPAQPLDPYPALKAWEERMFKREGVEKGRQVPDKHHRELLQDPEAMKAFEEKGRAFYRKMEGQPKQE